MKTFLLSFSTIATQFGAVFTDAESPIEALTNVTKAGLNAGGECAIFEVSKEDGDKMGRDQFFNKQQMLAAGYKTTETLCPPCRADVMANATRICEDCNEKLAYNVPMG